MRRPFRSHLLTLLLIVADAAAMCLIWPAAHSLRQWADPYFAVPINAYSPFYREALIPFLLVWWLILGGYGHYIHHRRISSLNEMRRMVQASFVLFLAMPALAWFLKEFDLGRAVILLAWGFLTLYLYFSRTLLRMAKRALIRRGVGLIRVVIFGTGETARQVAESIRNHPEVGYQVIGFVQGAEPEPAGGKAPLGPILGGKSDLPRIVTEHKPNEVFLADPQTSKDALLNLVVEMDEAEVAVKTVSDIMGVITTEFMEEEIADFPVMNLRDGHLPPGRTLVKRTLDLAIVLATAPFWGALWLGIAIYLWAKQGAPIHFRHERVGKDGKVFRLYKFRTMAAGTPPQARAPDDPGDPRITPSGRWLRRTSLDELPQLWNVLRGEMSLVGPRPEMPFIVEQYEEWQRRRLDVLPGVTGLWQVIGRKNLPLHYNLEYDFYYIRNQSLWLDITILLRTIPAVIFGRGAF